ncbi:MAG: transaldolase [bacterium]
MMKTSMQELNDFGQSVWLDDISRSSIENGRLKKMITLGLAGITTNPTIFEKAINKTADYDDKIRRLHDFGKTALEIYDDLTVEDVRDAADLLKPTYDATKGRDGYASLEIDPKLAFNAENSVSEGIRLFKKLNRPNVMIKIPATEAGLRAAQELTANGVNVNVTLIFSVDQYVKAFKSYVEGLEKRILNGLDVQNICSVASIFVSRLDTAVDNLIVQDIERKITIGQKRWVENLKGKSATANAKIIYASYLELIVSSRFGDLAVKGVLPQRILWASTGVNDPHDSRIKYVTNLIAKDTAVAMHLETFDVFLYQGKAKQALNSNINDALKIISNLKDVNIFMDDICRNLLVRGISLFSDSFDAVVNSIESRFEKVTA